MAPATPPTPPGKLYAQIPESSPGGFSGQLLGFAEELRDEGMAVGTSELLDAFAALALWPTARAIATDIDPVAIDVTRDNAAINRVPLGHGAGELLLAVADGSDTMAIDARLHGILISISTDSVLDT